MTIVKNTNQVDGLKGKYVLKLKDETLGDLYANIGLKPVVGVILVKLGLYK